jgi:hypothetical protein
MRRRLPLLLSVTALVVSPLGTTPAGPAVRDAVAAVAPVPFAKRADRAKLADNALRLNGRVSSTSPKTGDIPVVGPGGKLPARLGAIGPQGPAGPKGDPGAKGDVGAKGDRGPEGLVNAFAANGVGSSTLTPTATYTSVLSLPLQAGRYVILGQGGQAQYSGFCRVAVGSTLSVAGGAQGVRNPTVGGVGSGSEVTATLLHELTAPGTAHLQCWSPPSAPTRYSSPRLVALQIKRP